MSRVVQKKEVRRAFSLIDVLVSVAFAAVLLSAVLAVPDISMARANARSVQCASTLKGLANGFSTYFTENSGWIPGVNTTGQALRMQSLEEQIGNPRFPVTPGDWVAPTQTLRMPGNTKAERLKGIATQFRCAALPQSGTDLSYIMPDSFQKLGASAATSEDAAVPDGDTSVTLAKDYLPQVTKVGALDQKILVCDGPTDGEDPFVDPGAYASPSSVYGNASPRHEIGSKADINALCFDLSVRRLNSEQAKSPLWWYPVGSRIEHGSGRTVYP